MREEEECEPGCYRHIYFLEYCYGKIMRGECGRFNVDEVGEYNSAQQATVLPGYLDDAYYLAEET